jgi:soluble lytic murein transglycosylase-like protein
MIEPTTTTSSTIYIDPYSSACEQYSALAINLGWDPDQRTILESIMARESSCTPNAFNRKDPNGGSRGLLQINGSWHKWLIAKGIISKPKDLLDPVANLRAGLAIYNYGMDRYGFGWGPWGTK